MTGTPIRERSIMSHLINTRAQGPGTERPRTRHAAPPAHGMPARTAVTGHRPAPDTTTAGRTGLAAPQAVAASPMRR